LILVFEMSDSKERKKMSGFSWGEKETKYERISPKVVSSETDRVVFRVTSGTGEVSFLKVFIPQKTTTTHLVYFRREYAIGSFANNLGSLTANSFGGGESLPEGILKKLSQQKDIVKDIYSKGKKEQVLKRFPFIYTKPIPGETLADYLQRRTTPLPRNVIRKVAFQIIYIMARLHSEYGIVHNDLYEYNLIVEEHADYLKRMQKEGKPRKNDFYYAVETDFFKLSFEAEDLHVTVFDFGGSAVQTEADVYYTPANKKDLSKTWRTAGELTLAVNNPPEYIFGNSQNKTVASDAFMIGIVLATMAAHETWEQPDGATYAYTPYKSVHMYESGTEPKITSASRDVRGILGMVEFNGMTSAGVGDDETTIRFGLRYRQFYNEIFAQSNVKDPFQLQTSSYFYGNYPTSAENMFDGLQRLYQNSGGPSFLGLIRNLLNADTTARLRFGIPNTLPFRYCLTSALFHPFFEPLYIGYGGSVGIVADYLTTALAPPLPYNASQNKMALLEKAEADFNAKIASGNAFAEEEEEAQQDPQAAEALARAEREKEERLRQEAEEAERKKREADALATAAAAAAASAKAAADLAALQKQQADAAAAAAKALEEANAKTEAQRLAAEQARQEAEAKAQAAAAAQAEAQAQAEAKAKAATDAAAQQEADRRDAEEAKRLADEEAARAALAQSESVSKDLSPEMQRLVELAKAALKELPSASGRKGFYTNVQEALNLIYQVASKDGNVLAKLAAYGTVSTTGPKQSVEVPQGSKITREQFSFYTKEGKLIPIEVKANFIMIIASIYMLLTGNDISNDETHKIKKVGDMVAAATQKFGPAFEVDGKQSNASPAPEKEEATTIPSPSAPKKSKVNEPEIQKQGSGVVSMVDTQVLTENALTASSDIIAILLNGTSFDKAGQLDNIGRKVNFMRLAFDACDDSTKQTLRAAFQQFNVFDKSGNLYGGLAYTVNQELIEIGEDPFLIIPYKKSSNTWKIHLALYCALSSMAMMTKLVVYSLRKKKQVPAELVKLISQGDQSVLGLNSIFTQPSAKDFAKTNVIDIPDKVIAQIRTLDQILNETLPLQSPIDFGILNTQVIPLFAASATKHWGLISQNEAAFELARILRFHPEMAEFTNDRDQISERCTFIGTTIQEQQNYLDALGKLREFVEGNCNNISLASDALKSYRAFVKLSK
jgi:hypothetical protein